MPRLTFLLLLVVGLTLPATLAAQEESEDADGPDVSVTLDVPETVTLGEPAEATVTVTHKSDGEALPLDFVWYGASFRIGYSGREFLFARFNPPFVGGRAPQMPGKPEPVKAGKTETLTVPLLLPAAGTYEVTAAYRGRGKEPARTQPTESATKTITVKPRGDATELTVRVTTTKGEFTLGFWPLEALGTVMNFLSLCEKDFYDETKFHRIIDGFMSQGGDPKGNGMGGPGYSIPHEFNARKHGFGVISMARARHNDSAGSQFFLCAEDARFLDRQYTAFGETVDGKEVVRAINDVGTAEGGKNGMPPAETVVLKEAQIMAGDTPVPVKKKETKEE